MNNSGRLKGVPEEKTDDKQSQSYRIIWLDPAAEAKQICETEERLRSIINDVKKFQEVKPCQKHIEQSSNKDKIVLIVSGQLGEEIVPKVHGYEQVTSVYVYCMNKKRHEKWALTHGKTKAVVDELDDLVTRIAEDHNIQKKVDESLPIDIFTAKANAGQSTMDINGQFVFSQVLIGCLLRLKYNQTDKAELINCCKKKHEGNALEITNLRQFERDYKPDDALGWYTKDTFLYKTLNTALRKQDIHMIFLFREFISDIQRQLQRFQSEKKLTVYRGQMMSREELKRLEQSIEKLISINSFFSTSRDYSKVFSFLKVSRHLERVLFEITADPKMVTTKPFAEISKHSAYAAEAEVLFMIGSIFRLESVQPNDMGVWIVKMTLSSDEEHGLKQVLTYMKGQIGDEEIDLRTLGKILRNMGKFDLAERYLLRLLGELQSDDPLKSTLYEELGELAALTGNYDMSVQYHQQALKLKSGKEVNEKNGLLVVPSSLIQQGATQSSNKQQDSTDAKASTTAADGIEAQQFKQWLENYLKQHLRALAQQASSARRYPTSVENFCYILETQSPLTDKEQRMLGGLINFGFTFANINSEECVKLVRGIQNERIILILSRASMENLAKHIREEPFLSAIYVIDSSKENSFDSKFYRGSFTNIERICRQLEKDLPLLAYDLTLISSIPADYAKMSTLNYVQGLKDILLERDERGDLKKEMIEFCREKYAGNPIQLKIIDEFNSTFQPNNAIEWYARHETFVYKMLSRAFRILDADIFYKLRYMIQHLHRQLQSSSDKSSPTVYRTLRVRKDLFEKMKSYQNGLLSFNEFFWASTNQPTIEPFPINTNSKLVQFQINLDAGVPRHASVTRPNEILLTMGTVFRIDKVESVDDEKFVVKLTTNASILKASQAISKELRDAIRGPFPLVRMLKMVRMRELKDYMEYFANLLMNDSRTAEDEAVNSTLGGVFHSVAGHYYDRKQYDQGLVHYENALKVYLRFLSPDDIRLTSTYNNIGSSYFKQGLDEKALEYHKRAYEIQKNSNSPDLVSVSAYAQNIAGVLDRLGKHKEALKYYEMDLKIEQKLHSKKDKAEIAVKYHNLAGKQYRAHLYAEALENYQQCLEIELKCHSAENPTVAMTYHNMATALEKLGRLQEAKAAVEKAIERLLRTKTEDNEDVHTNRKYLQHLEQKLWMKDAFV